MAYLVFGISKALHSFFSCSDLYAMKVVGMMKSVTGHKRPHKHREEYAPIGVFMLGMIAVITVFAVVIGVCL